MIRDALMHYAKTLTHQTSNLRSQQFGAEALTNWTRRGRLISGGDSTGWHQLVRWLQWIINPGECGFG